MWPILVDEYVETYCYYYWSRGFSHWVTLLTNRYRSTDVTFGFYLLASFLKPVKKNLVFGRDNIARSYRDCVKRPWRPPTSHWWRRDALTARAGRLFATSLPLPSPSIPFSSLCAATLLPDESDRNTPCYDVVGANAGAAQLETRSLVYITNFRYSFHTPFCVILQFFKY